MKWGDAFKLALKAFLLGLLWMIAGILFIAAGVFLFLSGVRILAFFLGFAGLFLLFFGLFAAIFKVSSGAFVEKYELMMSPLEVTYEKQGFASILGQLIEQSLSKNPAKGNVVRDLKGSLVVEVTDMDVSATVEFNRDRITVYNGKPVEGKFAVISADFETINALSAGKAGLLKTLRWVLSGRLKIKGMRMARKFQSLLT
ncbi:SCP2 sterol-binding domain-containing protein [Archaeoglobus neptunius]|uniref:SCP2 sterol-binding domain-containing protein n=1 Tax=Archaeoglobus neptunius TaxID=2798580 RepID=UPI0019268A70|nr:SCP2 sterol-binding domain-containing protein [Archaeoglobus neptunius]